jgi:hypothetical protein
MFKIPTTGKPRPPVFPSDVRPDRKVQKPAQTMPKSMDSYEVIREKVLGEMQPKVAIPKKGPTKGVKKKLLTAME